MTRPDPIKPVYDFSCASAPVSLRSGKAEVHVGGEAFFGKTELVMSFTPAPHLVFRTEISTTNLQSLCLPIDEWAGASFSFDGQRIEGFRGRCEGIADGVAFDWRPELEPIELGEMEAKTSVAAIFHLFNFPDFHGGQHQASAPAGCDLLALESECWKTSVQALPQEATAQAWKQIRNEGGCVLTHMVKMERKDGARFSGKDVQAQCHLLANFLSFVKGTRCRPVCGVGFDAAQQETWKVFASPRSGVSAYSWFNPFEASQAECLYPLFAQRWHQSEHWEDCLRSTIYWYTQANTNGVSMGIDAAIILAQAALERLAYHYLVVEGTMTSRRFRGLPASKRLRELFSGLKLPVDICDLSPEIQKVAAQWEWLDASHALTDIRNELVHPVSKRQIANCLIDAWRLSLWYLELSVLALCGYEGTYTNRLAAKIVTDSESVPWA